jgi:hypothetical protein
MVAVVILGVATTGIAAMAFQSGRTSAATEATALRDAALRTELDRVALEPWASLTSLAGCTDRGSEAFAYTVCIGIDNTTETLREVRVFVDPEDGSTRGVSAVLQRSRTAPPTPF